MILIGKSLLDVYVPGIFELAIWGFNVSPIFFDGSLNEERT